jgi:hypothetical protein
MGWPVILVLLAGCGGGRTAAVSGKVTYQGKAVTGGSLTFTPVAASGDREPGKPGSAEVQPDGRYVVGTYSRGDGAVIGPHRVSYAPPVLPYPDGKEPKPGESPPSSGYEGLVPKTAEVEVRAGTNTIDVELVPEGK